MLVDSLIPHISPVGMLMLALKAGLLVALSNLLMAWLESTGPCRQKWFLLFCFLGLLIMPLNALLPQSGQEQYRWALALVPQGGDAASASVATALLAVAAIVYLTVAAWLMTRLLISISMTLGLIVNAQKRSLAAADGYKGLRRVSVLQSERDSGVFTWGFWRPVVVFPASSKQWNSEQRRFALAHEYAHIGAADWLWMLLARLVGILYWPLPGIKALQARLFLLMEVCADAAAVKALNREPARDCRVDYARFLLQQQGAPKALASLAFCQRSELAARFEYLFGDSVNGQRIHAVLLAVLLYCSSMLALLTVQPTYINLPDATAMSEPTPATLPASYFSIHQPERRFVVEWVGYERPSEIPLPGAPPGIKSDSDPPD